MHGIPQFRVSESDKEEEFQQTVKRYFKEKMYASMPSAEPKPDAAVEEAEAVEVDPERIPDPLHTGSIVVRGPRESLDMFFQRKYDESGAQKPFYNAHILCKHDVFPFKEAILEYANLNGLGGILEARNRDRETKERFDLFDEKWQLDSVNINDSQDTLDKYTTQIKTVLPPLDQALALFRVYTRGFRKEPIPGHVFPFKGMKSTALSLQYTNEFSYWSLADREKIVFTRIDVLPNTHVYFLPRYRQNNICSETEVVVTGNQRVHVYDASLCLEGRQEMREPPVEYRCTEYHYDESHPSFLPKVKYFFIISEPGRSFEYYPNYQGDETPLHVTFAGGGVALKISDENQLGYGNIYEIMDRFIDEKGKEQKRSKSRSLRLSNKRRRSVPSIRRTSKKRRSGKTKRRRSVQTMPTLLFA
jgi:hypothetical protein